jgi:predicted histone-like DNA-binding protein
MIRITSYKKTMCINNEKQDKLFLKMVPQERMSFNDLCALIAERTTLADYEVEFALAAVKDVIIDNIRIGRGTELGPLGSIELSVKADAVDTEEELNKKLIEKTKILYKPSKDIKKALKEVKYKIEK